ncbi:aspartyl/asparaginyl beta-hydroxylase domain-containing protein [Planktotalea sp.]|uniref:aspartyl/asparaginyl beta-hydroxylase domain-containing protein n=1 Tax=Planktotalea sp. TaxID=2029877 RepID=UPI003D6B8A34
MKNDLNTAQLPLVEKPETFLDLGPVDVAPLWAQVQRLSETVWLQEDNAKENKFDVFHHTRHIIFRFTPSNRDPREFYSNPIWMIWKPLLLPVMNGITAQYGLKQCEYSKVMLARLSAGAVIDRHVDGAGSNLVTHKVHVPLQTNEGAVFYIGDSKRHLAVGRAYEVNNIAPHGVENTGDEDRIHLIFEHFDAAT